MKKYGFVATCAILSAGVSADARPTFLGTGGAINEFDQGAGSVVPTDFTINVDEHIGIADVNVMLPLAHTWSGDLIIQLLFGGQSATLVSRIGSINGTLGSSSQFGQLGETASPNFFNYTFDSQSANSIWMAAAAAPAPGSILEATYATSTSGSGAPTGALNVFNGMDAFGVWTLRITDASSPNTGRLGNNWSLFIIPAPSGLAVLGLLGLLGRSRRRMT